MLLSGTVTLPSPCRREPCGSGGVLSRGTGSARCHRCPPPQDARPSGGFQAVPRVGHGVSMPAIGRGLGRLLWSMWHRYLPSRMIWPVGREAHCNRRFTTVAFGRDHNSLQIHRTRWHNILLTSSVPCAVLPGLWTTLGAYESRVCKGYRNSVYLTALSEWSSAKSPCRRGACGRAGDDIKGQCRSYRSLSQGNRIIKVFRGSRA